MPIPFPQKKYSGVREQQEKKIVGIDPLRELPAESPQRQGMQQDTGTSDD